MAPGRRSKQQPELTMLVTNMVAPDGGKGWITVLSLFVISFIVTGCLKSFATLEQHVCSEFPNASSSIVSWTAGVTMVVSLLLSPVTGLLLSEYGSKPLVLTGGLFCSFGLALCSFVPSAELLVACVICFVGVGSSFAYVSSITCIGTCFTTQQTGAMAIALAGGSFGTITFPYMVEAVCSTFGLRAAFLTMSACCSVICVCALGVPRRSYFASEAAEVKMNTIFYSPSILSTEELVADRHFIVEYLLELAQRLALSALGDPSFLLTGLSALILATGNQFFLYGLSVTCEFFGETPHSLFLYVAVGDLLARLFFGIFARYVPTARIGLCAASVLNAGVSVALIPLCSAFWQLALISVIAGFGVGIWIALTPIFLSSHHGSQNLSGTYALIRFIRGLAHLVNATLVEKVRIDLGTKAVFVLAGGMLSASAVSILFLHIVEKWNSRTRRETGSC